MSDFTLGVDISADASGVESGVNKVIDALNNLAGKVQENSDKLQNSFKKPQHEVDSFGGKLGDLAEKVAAAFAADKIIEFGKKCIDAFEEAQQASKLLETSFVNINGGSQQTFRELIDWTEKYSSSLHNLYRADELEGAEKQLSLLGLNKEQIEKLLPLVVDYAQATGKALPDATAAAVQAINGQSRGLKDIGGMFKDTGTLQGNYNTLLEKFAVVQGTANQTIGTAANQEKELNNQLTEQEERIGDKLTPAWLTLKKGLMDFVETCVDGLESVNTAIDAMQKKTDEMASEDMHASLTTEISDYDDKLKEAGKTQAEITKANITLLKQEAEGYMKTAQSATNAADYIAAMKQAQAVNAFASEGPEKNNLTGKMSERGQTAQGDGSDKIKSLDEIVQEAQAHMTSFGETKLTALDTEIKAIDDSMQKLFEKGLQNTDEFKQMTRALSQAKIQKVSVEINAHVKSLTIPEEAVKLPDMSKVMAQGDNISKQQNALDAIGSMAKQAAAAIKLFGDTDLSRLNKSLIDVEDQMIKLKASGQGGGDEFKGLVQQQEALKKAIDASTQAMNKQKQAADNMHELASSLNGVFGALAKGAGDAKIDIGSSIMKQLGELAEKKGEFYIAMGTADLLALNPMGALELSGGLALTALGAKISATKMAEGGVVSGSAFVNVGEYPGAAHNPEVIAPLNKLKNMGGGGSQNHTFTVEGNKLTSVLDKVNTNTMFNIGGGGS